MSEATSFPKPFNLYYHDPDNENWAADSYMKIASVNNFEDLFATMKEIGEKRFVEGMYFWMQNPYPPLWENKMNKRGGSYSIKISQDIAFETFQRYMAAAALDLVAKSSENAIVGVSISPKKGFNIIKLWNTQALQFKSPQDIRILMPSIHMSEVIYRPHVDQKMS